MAIVYLALGSNLGNRKDFLLKAIECLKTYSIEILKISSFIETAPVGGPPNQSHYLNGVIKINTALNPNELLTITQSIENKFGRIREEKDGPRTIDIDILLYDNLVMNSKHLCIPHPRMQERNFVLIPLKEIAPDIISKLKKIEQDNRPQ